MREATVWGAVASKGQAQGCDVGAHRLAASSTGEACRHFLSGAADVHSPACAPPRPRWACLYSLPIRHVPGGQPQLLQLGGHARARGRGVLVHGCHGGRFEGPLCLQRRRYTASEQAPFFYQLHSVVGCWQRVAACLGCMACWMLCALQSGSLVADGHGARSYMDAELGFAARRGLQVLAQETAQQLQEESML